MNLYTKLCSQVLFPCHEWLKDHDSVKRRKCLEESEWWEAEKLQRHRELRLREFLTDIGQRVPYYKSLFAYIGFNPEKLESLSDLQALPTLAKDDIRANLDALKAINHGVLTRYNTGGSSGEPLIFYMGKGRKSHDVAAKWRATRWWGVDIGDRELVVWGSPIELAAQDRVRRIRDGLMRSSLLPAFEMSPSNLDRYVDTIRRVRPAMLFGYPSSLSLIADHALRKRKVLNNLGLKVVFVTSERLYDEQRMVIEKVFGCPVANGYGARDAGFLAHQCPSGSLHISAEDIIIETLLPDGAPAAPGEAGELVITHMVTNDFPFVRYKTGDIGVLGTDPCECGRGLPVLKDVQGRTTDFVVASDGTVMHGLALIYVVRDLPGVKRFKIEQESMSRTVVKVVAASAFNEGSKQKIVRDFKARLGAAVTVDVECVDEIASEKSGKFRYVVSHVKTLPSTAGDS